MILRVAAAVLALAIFLFDTLLPFEGAVAVLYVLVVILAAGTAKRADIAAAASASVLLTIAAYAISHGLIHAGSSTLRAGVALAAIVIATLLALRNQAATARLAAQAKLIDLSHDMIFARDITGVITFWNRAAEETYGWTAAEAVGRVADELLGTRYPTTRQAVEAELAATGRWEGTLEQTTRTGAHLVLESRWAIQPASEGREAGVLETHTDVTARRAAHAALVMSERRYRRMFDSSRMGIVQEDWTALRAEFDRLGVTDAASLHVHLNDDPDFLHRARGLVRIEDVNPAFRAMAGGAEQLHTPETVDDVLSGTDRTFVEAMAAFLQGDPFYEGEAEVVGADGRPIPVLFAITFPTAEDGEGNILVFVVDITERKQAQDALLAAQAELAHAARVATLGELTASIAHEVNQPLMAVVTSGEAALRWLRRTPPHLDEVETSLGRVVSEGRRASEIVKRIRAFLKKAPAPESQISVPLLVEEAAALVRHELERARVATRICIDPGLPPVVGDRIQLQQILVNLMVNAGQAMAEHGGERRLSIHASQPAEDGIVISVSDTGPGIAADNIGRLFDPFFTTRRQGMGMGLAICRTTAEAHGGRLTVESIPTHGATFRLTLPAPRQETSS